MADIYPLLCEPHLAPKVWGGRRLETLFGKTLTPGVAIGESWEVADLPEGQSRVANGPLAGLTLGEVTAIWGADLVGTAWPSGRFPLLVKLLDAGDDLSVQVHPSDRDCAKWFPGQHGKDETWIVLAAEPSGRVVHGFLPGADRDEFERRLAAGTLPFCLQVTEAYPGMVRRIAPGEIHALLAGVVVLEIQQPSDTTFRVYDYGRDPVQRPLHLDQARQVLRFDAGEEIAPAKVLVDVPAYRIESLVRVQALVPFAPTTTWRVDGRSAQVLVLIEGHGKLLWQNKALPLSEGQTVVVPAAIGTVGFESHEDFAMILAGAGRVPLLEQD